MLVLVQRSFMEKRNHDLSRKMDNTKKDATKEKFRSINENTTLIAHCNELRKVCDHATGFSISGYVWVPWLLFGCTFLTAQSD